MKNGGLEVRLHALIELKLGGAEQPLCLELGETVYDTAGFLKQWKLGRPNTPYRESNQDNISVVLHPCCVLTSLQHQDNTSSRSYTGTSLEQQDGCTLH